MDCEIGLVIASAWSKNTQSTRNSQSRQYFRFCKMYGLKPLPGSEVTVARFLIFKARTSKNSTHNKYLSAIVVLHKFYGYPAELRSPYFMTMVMEGLRHKLGDTVDQSQPLTAERLLKMYKFVDHSKPKELLMWGVMILSFRSLLRKSNVVPDKYSELSDQKGSDRIGSCECH